MPSNSHFLCLDLITAAAQVAAGDLLTHQEQQLWHKRTSEQQKINFLAGRYTLKTLLRQHAGGDWQDWGIYPTHTGQPQVFYREQPAKLYASISHSRSRAAAALSTSQAIGVDIEDKKPRKNLKALMAYISNASEYADWLNSNGSLDEFYKRWTIKEAVGKLHGAGLNLTQPIAHNVFIDHPLNDERSICTIATQPFEQN
ncbi:MAG: 4'-phosphopantetheinyl transferase family protein [Formosimonas sp.]